MGCFFLNRILHKEHDERRRKGKGHQAKRQRNCCSQNSQFDKLPDEILVHIISFMPTKDCVRSTTLAKRWRFLWTRVPNLEFNRGEHKTMTSFSNFLNKFVFEHKGHNINTFRIPYEDDMDGSEYKSETETLIATAIACNVQVIDIHSGFELVLPQCLFTCKTLVDLTLYCEEEDSVPMLPMTGTNVYLPALKKLELEGYRYESEESLVHLISGCPALEELTIHKEDDNVVCVFVSSPTLTRLHLSKGFAAKNKAGEVRLDTPALKYLELHDSKSENFSTGMLSSLIEADVGFSAPTDDDVLYSRSVLEFVSKLNNVSCLALKISLMKVPDSVLTDSALTTTEFRNLTKLEFDGDLCLVTKFLENSDNLEVLTIDTVVVGKHSWMEPKQVPVCLIYHLQTVKFFNFKCSEPEFNMVKYILKNAKVLTKMKIKTSFSRFDLKKKEKALERINLLERASEACHLTIKFD